MKIDRRISTEVADEIRRLVPILGREKASRLESAYLLADDEMKKRILEMIDTVKAAVFSDKDLKNTVLIEPPPQEMVNKGELNFGAVLYGKKKLYPLLLSKDILLTHIGIFGSSGYGKTNLVQWLIINLARLNIPVLVFDFSKRNYRDLLQIEELKDKIKIYTVGRNVSPFRFNPLKPPEGIQISQWAKEFSEIFDHAFWMMGGGRHIILKALDELYKNVEEKFPRIKDLKEWLEKYRLSRTSSREKNWIATAERPLESLCFRELGDVFDCDEGIKPSEFFKEGRITILELDSLSTNDKTFFIEVILQWIRDMMLVSNLREKLVGVIALEEAHHVLNREKSKVLGMETVIDLIFREIRELGVGMIYVDQHPSLISYPALGNTSTHIYMNLGLDTKHSSDVLDASNMLGLKYEEEGDYLRRLPVGDAFMLIRGSDFPNPFLVKFPLVNVKKGMITDEKVKEFMQTKLLKEVRKIKEEKTEKVEKIPEREEISLDDSSLRIIEALGKAKGSTSSEIYSILRMSGSSFKKRAENLLNSGLIGFSIGKVYKQKAKFYFLTKRGEEVFKENFEALEENIETDLNEVKTFLINYFMLKGFKLTETNQDGIVLERGERKFKVKIITKNKDIEDFQDYDFFVYLSNTLRNLLTQRIAKYCFENKLSKTINLAGLERLKEGKDFEKIEFIS